MRVFVFMLAVVLFGGCDKQEPKGGEIAGPLSTPGQVAGTGTGSENEPVTPASMPEPKPKRTQWSFEQTTDLISAAPKFELVAHAKSENFAYQLAFHCGAVRSIEVALFGNDGQGRSIVFQRDGGTYARWVRIRAGTEIIPMPVLRGEYSNAGKVGFSNMFSAIFAATNPNDAKIELNLAQEHAKQLNIFLASDVLNMADLIEGDAVEFLPDEGRDSINAFLRACTPVASVSEQKAADSSTVEAASETHVGKEDDYWPNWDQLFEKETTCQSDRFNFAVTLKGLGSASEILVAGESHTFRLDSSHASGKMFGSNPTFLSGNEQKFISDFSEIRDYVIELSGSEKGILFGDVSFEQRKNEVWTKTGSNLKFRCD